jgi:hypothetical protein
MMAASSAVSGAILYRLGWNMLNYAALPLLILTAAALVWFTLHRRAAYRTAAAVPTILE